MSDSDAVTFSIVSNELNIGEYAALSDMMGFVIDRATNKQCSVLYYLLRGYNQKKVAQMLSLEPPTVNQHVNAVGWTAIRDSHRRWILGNGNNRLPRPQSVWTCWWHWPTS